MNLLEEVNKLKKEYNEENAQARLCQDIVLKGIANSDMYKNITIKGGIVMRSLSDNNRRATQDVDIDFIKKSISNESILKFISAINNIEGIRITSNNDFEELNHHDYKGKRVYLVISDSFGNSLNTKLDIGVHVDMDVEQVNHYFNLCFEEDSISLLINPSEQMICEKMKSLLRFGTRSTRYKDIFDICYLLRNDENKKLNFFINKYIFEDMTLPINNIEKLIKRLEMIFSDKTYIDRIMKSKKNWLNEDVEIVFNEIINYLKRCI